MARSGNGRSEWERRQAAQRREAERNAREQARQAKEAERVRQQKYIEDQQKLAEKKSTEVEERIRHLDSILADALDNSPFSFDLLTVTPRMPTFNPGLLGTPEPQPDWATYVPAPPGIVGKIFGGAARYERELIAARHSYESDVTDHQQRESKRLSALANARAEHDRWAGELQAKASAENAQLDRRRQGLEVGDAKAVEWFVSQVLKTAQYPTGFPRRSQVAYRPENRDVVVEFELAPRNVVPDVRGYKYIKTRDAIAPIPRPQTEIKQRYAQLIARTALRTLHEIFSATPPAVIEAVVFNGRLSTVDLATGKQVRPHLLSVEAERSDFIDLVLSKVDPAACLKRLNALISANPYDVEAIEPFIAFDLKRFRFSEDMDVISALDSRRNLLKLTPTEFEHLIRELFIAMGAEAWTTIPSKDGGIDAVATSKNMFFGGVCLIQAKRWSGIVGLEAVHALTGVMADHNATTGVLVTPSWFGRASEQFAQRNRITLINGAELKHLLKEHLKIDVITGVTPPRRVRGSDNTQTGRPGP
ncbi:restriction endonuclease [Streptosporangium sp. NPDC049304]|uniref:restriction endonuclease n=1 Tax=Streptosporangium sp. NPDC049304 TaxID=3154830 RepID=UPI00341C5FDF